MGLEHGSCKLFRAIGDAGRLVRAKEDIPVSKHEVDEGKSRSAAHQEESTDCAIWRRRAFYKSGSSFTTASPVNMRLNCCVHVSC